MATNVQKTPLAVSLGRVGDLKAANAIERLGKCLPCSVVSVTGSIVRVNFEVNAGVQTLPQVTMPVFGPEYIRYPIQRGDKGMAVAADVYLGQMSGLGDGVADLSRRANLSQLVFLPIGNRNWSAVDGNALVLYGPNGVVLRDGASRVTVTLTPFGIDINLGGNTMHITNGDLHVDGSIIGGYGSGDQIGLMTHRHTQPADSRGDTEHITDPPVPGT